MTQTNQYSLLIGRWQPFHDGHKALVQSVIDEGKLPCIAIRNTPKNDDNPYSVAERAEMIRAVFPHVKIIEIPDISEIVYGRKVGYDIREVHLPPHIEAISGTAIRNSL